MIDTIRLRVNKEDVLVDKYADVTIESPKWLYYDTDLYSDELFKTSDGGTTYGKKAYINCDFVKVTFRDSGTYVHFSFPRSKYRDHNAYTVSLSDAYSIIDKHQKTLCDAGVKLDLINAHLSRVDLFRDILMDHRFETYFTLFEKMHASRMSRRRYRTTYNFSNSVSELEFYDKYQQMLDTEGMVAPNNFPKNTMRIELRFLQGAKCKKILSVSTINDLLTKWKDLPAIYEDTVNNLIFSRFDNDGLKNTVCYDDTEMLRQSYTNYKQQPFSYYTKQLGRLELLKRWPDQNLLRQVMLEFQDKSAVSKSLATVNSVLSNPTYEKDCQIPLADLYAELHNKLITK